MPFIKVLRIIGQHIVPLSLCFLLITGSVYILTSTAAAGSKHLPNWETANLGQSGDSEDRYAWAIFESLTHPTVETPDSQEPEWNTWKTKCEVGLLSFCQNEPAKNHRTEVPPDLRGIEFPAQYFVPETTNALLKNHAPGLFDVDWSKGFQGISLATVLFNPEAAHSIQRSDLAVKAALDEAVIKLDRAKKKGAKRRFPEGAIETGSMAVKLIWELVSVDSSDSMLYVYDSDPNLGITLPGASREDSPGTWKNTYYLLTSEKTCPNTLPPYGGKIPIGCFYSQPVHDPNNVGGAVSIILRTNYDPRKPTYAILVGFHVMKLTASNPDWLWATFFWVKSMKAHPRWKSPWSHYDVKSTTAIRELAQGTHRYCYNPYLEGWRSPNGMHSNCLSCHSFASYPVPPDGVMNGNEMGVRDPYSLSCRRHDEKRYFRGAVQTSFIWSLSDNQNNTLLKEEHKFIEYLHSPELARHY